MKSKILLFGGIFCALTSLIQEGEEISTDARKSIEKGINWIKANQHRTGYWG